MTKFSWQFDPLSDEPNKIEITADGVPFAKTSTLDNAKRICKTLADGLQLAAAQKRIAELEQWHAALHDTLRRMGQSWLALAVSLTTDPRRQGESRILKDCADDLARNDEC